MRLTLLRKYIESNCGMESLLDLSIFFGSFHFLAHTPLQNSADLLRRPDWKNTAIFVHLGCDLPLSPSTLHLGWQLTLATVSNLIKPELLPKLPLQEGPLARKNFSGESQSLRIFLYAAVA